MPFPRTFSSIKDAPMKARAEADQTRLTSYEADQIEQIAAWKSEPPHPLAELWKRITLPVGKTLEKLIPDPLINAVIQGSYGAAARLAGQEDIKREAGVGDLAELRNRPLEQCDRLAKQVGMTALVLGDRRRCSHRRRRRLDHTGRRAVAFRPGAEDNPPDRPLLRLFAGASQRPAIRPGRARRRGLRVARDPTAPASPARDKSKNC